ncbi:MAG: hypothetical protein KF752_08910 [Pirellulaceae bacterium]|nr:hypothetical protein [Pirellulaceae bacterium]
MKLRPDLEWSEYGRVCKTRWVARDPVSLEHFYFSDLEKAVLQQLNGARTLADVLANGLSMQINAEWLLSLVSRVAAAGLLLSHQPSKSARSLWTKRQQVDSGRLLQWLINPLAIRIPLFDPTRLLTALSPLATVLFSKTLLLCVAIASPLLIFLVWLQFLRHDAWQTIQLALAQTTAEQVVTWLAIYVCLKSMHELGHALACRKWGAECHEIGIMFLVLMPVLYCNTTDSWKIPSHWRRASIAAAGVYVELLIAVGAACVWLTTLPSSWLHDIAAYTMFVSALSTVVINANPLLRYDGYYVLSDLIGIPNLSEQSRELFQRLTTSFLTGSRLQLRHTDGPDWFLLIYGIASLLFRTMLLITILGIVWVGLDRVGLRLVAIGICGVCLGRIAFGGFWTAVQRVKQIQGVGRVLWSRIVVMLGMLLTASWLVFSFQWTTFATARAVSSFANLSPLYAQQAGEVVSLQQPGVDIAQGQAVIRLRSHELEMEQLAAEGKQRLMEQRLAHLRLSQANDESSVFEMADVIEQLAAHEVQTQLLSQQVELLTVRAPQAGHFVESGLQASRSITEPVNAVQWNPLHRPANLGAYVERGSLLGWVAHSEQMQLTAIVPEHTARLIQPGMEVRCRWDCDVTRLHEGQVRQVSVEPVHVTPESLVGDRTFQSKLATGGRLEPKGNQFEVLIELRSWPPGVSHQSLATVHVVTGRGTVWDVAKRYYSLNIRPQLVNRNR